MLNDSKYSTILLDMGHLFDDQLSLDGISSKNNENLFSISTTNDFPFDLTFNNDLVNEFDFYLKNENNLSNNSRLSSPLASLSPNSLTQPQFEFILKASTASSSKVNEETTTYLNQDQHYEIKFRSHNHSSSSSSSDNSYPFVYRSILRLCFWNKTLQNQEYELMQRWMNEYHLLSLFDIDMNLTYGVLSIIRSKQVPNAIEIVWDTSTTASLCIRFKCTSTDFAHKRHGGEKGFPLRIQIDTYETNHVNVKHLYSCCCKIQLFRLKGAQRKTKADRIKIEKLNHGQRRQYQTPAEYTILQPCAVSPLYTLDLLSLSYLPDDLSDICMQSTLTTDSITLRNQNCKNMNEAQNNNVDYPSLSLLNMKSTSTELQNDTITVQSSNEDVLNWLNRHNFSSVINQFQHYTGVDILRLTKNDTRRICNDDDSISIRLCHHLNQTIIAPLKILYIKIANAHAYSALYLHALTRQELEVKLFELIKKKPNNIVIELNKLKIKIDNDNDVKYSLPNGGQFDLTISSYEFILHSIDHVE